MTGEGGTTESSIIPGLNLNMRIPILIKVKSFIGIEFFTDLNLAPSVQMKEIKNNSTSFKSTRNTTMTHASIGMAVCFKVK